MSYYDKYIKYKKKYLSFVNKKSGGAKNNEEKQGEELNLDSYGFIDKEEFKNTDVFDFTAPLKSVRNNIPKNTRELVDILHNIYSVVISSSGERFTTSQFNDMNIANVNYNQLYNLTLALYNYHHRILSNQGIIEPEALLITNIINQLITPNTYNSLTTVEKFLLGGLRSLYTKLNTLLPTKPTPESTRGPPPESTSEPPSNPPPESTSNPPPESTSSS